MCCEFGRHMEVIWILSSSWLLAKVLAVMKVRVLLSIRSNSQNFESENVKWLHTWGTKRLLDMLYKDTKSMIMQRCVRTVIIFATNYYQQQIKYQRSSQNSKQRILHQIYNYSWLAGLLNSRDVLKVCDNDIIVTLQSSLHIFDCLYKCYGQNGSTDYNSAI
jgi:hypothetical protein